MPEVTIITDAAHTIDATGFHVPPDTLPEIIGWTLKPEGLCRDEVCVPVSGALPVVDDGRVDIAAVAATLRRPCVIDTESGIAAIALDAEARHQALDALRAPPFTLPDLDGVRHDFAEWSGTKRLLIAFSSW